MDTILDAVGAGVAPAPHHQPLRIVFEYTNGITLVLEDDSLTTWFNGYMQMLSLYHQIMNTSYTPTATSEDVRNAFRQQGKSAPEKKD